MTVEENFEFRCSETVQKFNKYLRILSPWLKQILNSTVLKCFKMKDFHRHLRKCRILSPWLKKNKMKDFHRYLRESESTFTMVEENFELYGSEMLQNPFP